MRFGDQELRIEVTGGDEDRLASDAYHRVVGNVYAIDSDCPPSGTYIRITSCVVCRPNIVVAVETGGRDSFESEPSRLWIRRTYINVAPPRPADRYAVSIVSMVLARYNRRDGLRRGVWIRDVLGHALDTYSKQDRAYSFIRRFGTEDLGTGVPALVEIARQHGSEVGLVRALPFLPPDPKSSPFVGAWGTFATEAFLEQPAGTLTRLFGPPGGG